MTFWAALGFVLTVIGSSLLYAGAPNQRLTDGGRRPLLLMIGASAQVLALPVLLAYFGGVASVFIWMTMPMLIWSIMPLAVAWRRGPKEKRR